MVNVTCLNSVSLWEREQISKYPELKGFIEKLKNMIRGRPESGLFDPVLSKSGKTIPCKKLSVNISLFSFQYALGYSFITASYVSNDTNSLIIKITYS